MQKINLVNILSTQLAYALLLEGKYDYVIGVEATTRGLLWDHIQANRIIVNELSEKVFKPMCLVVPETSPCANRLPEINSNYKKIAKNSNGIKYLQ